MSIQLSWANAWTVVDHEFSLRRRPGIRTRPLRILL
jgi:hypothetical protein